MKKLFEELVAKAKVIENKCKKDPIETIPNSLSEEIFLEGRWYQILQH